MFQLEQFNKKQKVILIIALAMLFSFFLMKYLNILISKEKIKNNHVVVCGTILEMNEGFWTKVVYEFRFNGRRYESDVHAPKSIYESYKKGNNHLFVIMEKGKPNNHGILLDDNFGEYNVTKEDTINVLCK